ncbi:Mannitol-specific phosphotransferase enzyme IIA component [Nonomuraea coxensis DSM 45129]|uniref:Mannitol-specific phosphotransferase enzyme IIA component n=1 Tax=Nonomuraea coxensis DSM 45129 TaxID=1122611 RepID=A0ABX8U0P9_9ACTN|nr:PTS sugar transporter subunit IIA [Nonomuraea coxensis]QYC41317.1 Mannitol-specific phosphotransferase enzyme IIA component [Nonomuraea coxensis DSM 45129]
MREDLLDPRAVLLHERAPDREAAIRRCGRALVEVGAVAEPYVAAMLERERSVSTYVGEGVAIPHGTNASKDDILRDALCFIRFPDGVDWDGEQVTVCVGIAAREGGHVPLLAALAEILLDPGRARTLREATEVAQVMKELTL